MELLSYAYFRAIAVAALTILSSTVHSQYVANQFYHCPSMLPFYTGGVLNQYYVCFTQAFVESLENKSWATDTGVRESMTNLLAPFNELCKSNLLQAGPFIA